MARPTWVTVVGVLGILFGCTGILSGTQQMMMPKMMEMQKSIFADFNSPDRNSNCSDSRAIAPSSAGGSGDGTPAARSADQATSSPDAGFSASRSSGCQRAASLPDVAEPLKDFWDAPPWFARWALITGGLRSLVGAFYLFAAIWFIQMKRSSIWLLTSALSLSIVLSLVQLASLLFGSAFMLAAMMMGSSVGMLIDVVLLLVIWLSDRSGFKARAGALQPSGAAP